LTITNNPLVFKKGCFYDDVDKKEKKIFQI